MEQRDIKIKGFTLIELMVTLTVVGIIAAIAAPNFSSIIKNNRLTTQVNELLTSLSVARSEAVKRGTTITVCKSSDSATCSGDWKDGWIVFTDMDSNGVVGDGEQIIRSHAALGHGISLSFPRNRVTYSHDALAMGYTGTFILSDSRGCQFKKGLVISNTGRVRQALDADMAACP